MYKTGTKARKEHVLLLCIDRNWSVAQAGNQEVTAPQMPGKTAEDAVKRLLNW